MKLIEISEKSDWESFETKQPFAQFLQSWAWGEFRLLHGNPIKRFALLQDNGEWLIAASFEYRLRKFGIGYWFAARGPVMKADLSEEESRFAMAVFCEELLKLPELRKRVLFWRMEPAVELKSPEGLIPLAFRRSSAQNPASTLVIDLSSSLEDILSGMHEKTRYNVRVSGRHGVRIKVAQSKNEIQAFLDLMDETAKRDGFVQHSREYLEATYAHLNERNMARIRLAFLDDKLLAGNFEVFYGDTATYLYGASSSLCRNAMAPYALHWHAIQEAKVTGLTKYDFWGINPEFKGMYYYKPTWEGITRFKLGWGGRRVDFIGTWDLPFNSFLYRTLFLKGFFRG